MASRRPTRRACIRLLALAAIGVAFFWAGNGALHARRIANNVRRELAQRKLLLDAEIGEEEGRLAALKGGRQQATYSGPAAAQAGPAKAFHPPDPKIDHLFLHMYRTGLAVQFAQVYQVLGLSPAQISQFEGLMTAYQETNIELRALRAIALSDGTSAAVPQVAEIEREARNSRDTGLLALLGEEGLQQVLGQERIGVAQQFLVRSAQGGYPPEPLSAPQMAAMITIMESTSPSFQAGGSLNSAMLDWDTVLARARGILSQGQIESVQATVGVYRLDRLRNRYFTK